MPTWSSISLELPNLMNPTSFLITQQQSRAESPSVVQPLHDFIQLHCSPTLTGMYFIWLLYVLHSHLLHFADVYSEHMLDNDYFQPEFHAPISVIFVWCCLSTMNHNSFCLKLDILFLKSHFEEATTFLFSNLRVLLYFPFHLLTTQRVPNPNPILLGLTFQFKIYENILFVLRFSNQHI